MWPSGLRNAAICIGLEVSGLVRYNRNQCKHLSVSLIFDWTVHARTQFEQAVDRVVKVAYGEVQERRVAGAEHGLFTIERTSMMGV